MTQDFCIFYTLSLSLISSAGYQRDLVEKVKNSSKVLCYYAPFKFVYYRQNCFHSLILKWYVPFEGVQLGSISLRKIFKDAFSERFYALMQSFSSTEAFSSLIVANGKTFISTYYFRKREMSQWYNEVSKRGCGIPIVCLTFC